MMPPSGMSRRSIARARRSSRLHVYARPAQGRVGVGHAVQAPARAADPADQADEVSDVPVGLRALETSVEQVAKQLAGARARAPQVAGGEVGHERGRAFESCRGIEQAGERPRRPRTAVGDRRQPPPRAPQSRRAARSPSCPSARRRSRTAAPGDSRAGPARRKGREPGSACADTTLPAASATASWSSGSESCSLDARGAQRQRAAERAAQVVALGQLVGVGREQLARPRQEDRDQVASARASLPVILWPPPRGQRAAAL